MKALLVLSRWIDAVNIVIGRAVTWLILVAVIVSAGNALIRKLFSMSSNAWLELQWYLFGAVFLLTAGYTLLKNEHVRVDVLSQRFSPRTRVKVEIFGILLFILPASLVIMWLSWPVFVDAFVHNEQSSNSGGLIRWPAKLLIPVGFALLVAAAISHLIKCIAYLRGLCADPTQAANSGSSEQQLAEEIGRAAAEREQALQHRNL
ncbi:TRAP transporter small permease subunit [Allopusillimonas ginsengisoli]|uniref:TRAP transporter small permease subunit n=1 Tax=Allopusillimonas ginsengisoli TaxID=453575 RepID=UPI0010225EB4|nr:TRAP transporter small permease subunit [Allopusillimonas ginsengisoli]TEA74124.1 TRAP transporter small permease subunit [Allopusillimonas ginsengisoli]